MIMKTNAEILRKLAWEYAAIANSDKNSENIKLHRAVNDLKQIRPVILIDELPWNEMNIDDELTIQCNDKYLQGIEWFLRMHIYKNKYMPADMIVPNYIPIEKEVNTTGNGISVEELTLPTDKDNCIVSHKYKDIFEKEEDLEKLHLPVLTYDKERTMQHYNLVGEILGDVIPVKVTGQMYFSSSPWDDIARYRGVTNLLIGLVDQPEFMHKIVSKLVEIDLSYLEQMEALNLFDTDPYNLHCTALHVSDLPSEKYEGMGMRRENIWGRGAAQIFASVSKEMHEEFDINYMKRTVGQCGLVYYGCCEPLDKKIDIVEKIPNLRKISITPWADVNVAAEAINKKYVLASKPTPASVAVNKLNKENLKEEIGTILNACKKNNCSCDIVLKDISTCNNRPQNIFEWEQIVMEMVNNF